MVYWALAGRGVQSREQPWFDVAQVRRTQPSALAASCLQHTSGWNGPAAHAGAESGVYGEPAALPHRAPSAAVLRGNRRRRVCSCFASPDSFRSRLPCRARRERRPALSVGRLRVAGPHERAFASGRLSDHGAIGGSLVDSDSGLPAGAPRRSETARHRRGTCGVARRTRANCREDSGRNAPAPGFSSITVDCRARSFHPRLLL